MHRLLYCVSVLLVIGSISIAVSAQLARSRSLDELVSWAESNGAKIHDSLVFKVVDDETVRGFASRHIPVQRCCVLRISI